MKRRNFFRTSALTSIPVMMNGMKLSAVPFPFAMNGGRDNDRVLVLVQLNGGNDGLNTVIPKDQYSALSALRPNIMIPENTVLTIEDKIALHPSMVKMQEMYLDGKVGIVQGVAYPNQDRSHFRSTDIWTSGSGATEYLPTGWLGRYFYDGHPDYPEGYPNADYDAPFALTMGSLVSETCQGPLTNFSLALNDPFALTPLSEGGGDSIPDNNYGKELRFLIDAIAQTNAYASVITDAANAGSNQVTYTATNRLAQQLKNVALLISGGLKTKVYIVSLGGFDTHSGQTDQDTTQGGHADLLQQLSEAISTFHEDLKLAGKDEKVLTMTFSEFGRQIRSNDSLGTDHGTAAPLFLFGSCVKPGVLGENAQLDINSDPQEGVAMQYDFRSVYATVLRDWLVMDESTIYQILNPDVQFLPLVEGCSLSTAIQNEVFLDTHFKLYPNPASSQTTMEWKSNGQSWTATMLDKWGHEIRTWSGSKLNGATMSQRLNLPSVPSGHYYINLRQGNQSVTKGIMIN
ncbi:MAG TPA: DUF1501 domain-containing protein [Saprospiraceae bacterium]|nr:DUF1501 domain-containing protein [Saprospiraceae bacterium]